MIETLLRFFYMNGHGLYVWISYGSVFAFLAIQWFMAWRRWRIYSRQHDLDPAQQDETLSSHEYNIMK